MKAFHPVEKDMVLHFEDVSFSYGNLRVLNHTSFHIHQGEFITLAGPNGAGKTTILKLMLGLEVPTGGTVQVLGTSPVNARNRVGYVPQQAGFDETFPITVEEVVGMGALRPLSRRFSRGSREAVKKALDRTSTAGLSGRSYNALSGGQRRRVLVARALASEPELLILDEPTANMDLESEAELSRTLAELKGTTTILVVTHDMEFVSSLTNRVLCLEQGVGERVVQHKITELLGRDRAGVIHGVSIAGDTCFEEEMQ
ncbi:MAG: metal ABC transporter ATP-binding protein [Spirochaetaceae bacterium]|jgi:zinc transport system ATP-binding protein|nr:metal ABC transporter ATP-binding protein [Spirochaetaceae bacterium]